MVGSTADRDARQAASRLKERRRKEKESESDNQFEVERIILRELNLAGQGLQTPSGSPGTVTRWWRYKPLNGMPLGRLVA